MGPPLEGPILNQSMRAVTSGDIPLAANSLKTSQNFPPPMQPAGEVSANMQGSDDFSDQCMCSNGFNYLLY